MSSLWEDYFNLKPYGVINLIDSRIKFFTYYSPFWILGLIITIASVHVYSNATDTNTIVAWTVTLLFGSMGVWALSGMFLPGMIKDWNRIIPHQRQLYKEQVRRDELKKLSGILITWIDPVKLNCHLKCSCGVEWIKIIDCNFPRKYKQRTGTILRYLSFVKKCGNCGSDTSRIIGYNKTGGVDYFLPKPDTDGILENERSGDEWM